MKFIHIADVHLGAKPDAGTAYSAERPRELWESFSQVIYLCESEKIDVLLVAGDLFHRQPLYRELKEINYLFSNLTYTQVILIAGNHDYVKNGSYYLTFKWNENVHFLSDSRMSYKILQDLDLTVYGFSYHCREMKEEMPALKAPGRTSREILLLHGGDEKHLPIRRQLLERSGFSYVALGHIHKPQVLVENMAMYAGALEPTDKNDIGAHGFIRGIFEDQQVRAQFVPFAKREYIHQIISVDDSMTNGSLRDLIKRTVETSGVQHIYKFVLQGFRQHDIVFDTEYLDTYGNILEVVDETKLAYNYVHLYEQNKDNLIGKFISEFSGCEEGSLEFLALQEGMQALLDNTNIEDTAL